MPRSSLAAVVAASLAGGCSDAHVDRAETGACGPVISVLAIKDKFDQAASIFVTGEPITFETRMTNRGERPQLLRTTNSCNLVALTVTDSTNQTVWGVSDGVYCAAVPTAQLAAGEVKVMEVEWEQQTRGGSQALPGNYTAHARTGVVESDGLACELRRIAEFTLR